LTNSGGRQEKAPLSMSRRVPVGVVGVIAPFNAPVKLAIRSVAPALGLGNAVILKPDPRTPVSGGVVFARIFEEAGLPAGVLHVLPGGADVGSAMVTDANVQAVSFTGSTKAGQSVGELGGRHFTRVQLELGGNNALIVMGDADLDRTVAAAADGLTVGNPATDDVDLGPIIDERQRDKIHSLVTGSVTAGATLRVGGTYDGLFYRPTVLTGAGPGTPAYDSEVFGPVAPVIPFATPGEAIDLAADSEYGLDLSIMTADIGAGLQMALSIPTGTAHINDQTVEDDANAPFGGMRHSGNSARFGGAAANIEAYTDTRWITARSTVPD
jgi:benzaldehyde dehydrogenase (NAD)